MGGSILSPPKKPINKWVTAILLLTTVLTAWIFFNNEANNTDVFVSNKFKQPSVLESQTEKPIQTNQENFKNAVNSSSAVKTNKAVVLWQQLARKPQADIPNNLFKIHSWIVEIPVVKQKQMPAPPPVVPPVPFTYIGKLEDPLKGTQVFLMLNNRLYSTFKGDKINQQWRLDAEDIDNIYLTFLPLNLPQLLSKSTLSPESSVFTDPISVDVNT